MGKALRFTLLGGLIAATLDILYAIVLWSFRGVSAERVLQSVASGLLGRGAYEGGVATAASGLVLHFLLMLIIAAIFYFGTRRLEFARRHAFTAGALYGVLVYWVMNLVVLPLSAYPGATSFAPVDVALGLLAHAFLIGVPIALAVRTGSAGPQQPPLYARE